MPDDIERSDPDSLLGLSALHLKVTQRASATRDTREPAPGVRPKRHSVRLGFPAMTFPRKVLLAVLIAAVLIAAVVIVLGLQGMSEFVSGQDEIQRAFGD